jgi:hypothetical protein
MSSPVTPAKMSNAIGFPSKSGDKLMSAVSSVIASMQVARNERVARVMANQGTRTKRPNEAAT